MSARNHSIDCQGCLEKLDEYRRAELRAEELAEVQAHLDHCESCRQELQDQEMIAAALRDSALLPAGNPDFAAMRAAVLEEIRANTHKSDRQIGSRLKSDRMFFAVAAAIVVTIGLTWLISNRDFGGDDGTGNREIADYARKAPSPAAAEPAAPATDADDTEIQTRRSVEAPVSMDAGRELSKAEQREQAVENDWYFGQTDDGRRIASETDSDAQEAFKPRMAAPLPSEATPVASAVGSLEAAASLSDSHTGPVPLANGQMGAPTAARVPAQAPIPRQELAARPASPEAPGAPASAARDRASLAAASTPASHLGLKESVTTTEDASGFSASARTRSLSYFTNDTRTTASINETVQSAENARLRGDWLSAIRYYEEIIRTGSPTHQAGAHLRIAEIALYQLQDYARAISEYENVLRPNLASSLSTEQQAEARNRMAEARRLQQAESATPNMP